MTSKAGIWIDLEHAIVVLLRDGKEEIHLFHASKGEVFPSTIQSRAEHGYTPNDFVPENRLERKQHNDRKAMYNAVLDFVEHADSLYIIGPGEAGREFEKYIATKKSASFEVEVEKSGKMTTPQLAAKVREHFKLVH